MMVLLYRIVFVVNGRSEEFEQIEGGASSFVDVLLLVEGKVSKRLDLDFKFEPLCGRKEESSKFEKSTDHEENRRKHDATILH